MKEIVKLQSIVDEIKHLTSIRKYILAEIKTQQAIEELIHYIDFLGLRSNKNGSFVTSPILDKMLVELHYVQHHINTLIKQNPISLNN